MKLKWTPEGIEFNKVENELDKLTFKFCSILNKRKIEYVIVSGYVAILFGRNRMSEDIDILIKKLSYDEFAALWGDLTKELECLNAADVKNAYNEYLEKNTAIRFAWEKCFMPNVEIKWIKKDLDWLSLNNKIKVSVNNNVIYISPIELQIAFKLYLGSDKDLEDARYMYDLFRGRLNRALLNELCRKLNIDIEHKRFIR